MIIKDINGNSIYVRSLDESIDQVTSIIYDKNYPKEDKMYWRDLLGRLKAEEIHYDAFAVY